MTRASTHPMRLFWLLLALSTVLTATGDPFRPPAVPLVAFDPYFSIWSPADKLSERNTVHWTHKPHRLTSLVRIDSRVFRLMGAEPGSVEALPQRDLEVSPTRTSYVFEGAGVRVTLRFTTPALPEDLMVYSRPVTYLRWEVKALDSMKHAVDVYFDASAEITVEQGSERALARVEPTHGLSVLKLGAKEQAVLARKGDDLRIDWGYLYLASKQAQSATIGSEASQRQEFIDGVSAANRRQIRVSEEGPAHDLVGALTMSFGRVGGQPKSRWLVMAYDDEFALQYFKRNLRPY